MSHRATNWAFDQRQLKPAPWRVLVMLADRHNKDTLRVDPEQASLAFDCNMSRSSVNRHLADLEEEGYLVRVPRLDPRTQKQLSTFYILQIDFASPPDIPFAVSDFGTRIEALLDQNISRTRVPNSDTGAVSQKPQIPCPKKRDSRVPNSDTNPVREPVREPCADPAIADLLPKFLAVYPRIRNEAETASALLKAVQSGAHPEVLLNSAKAFAREQSGNAARFVPYPESWLKERRWEQFSQKNDCEQSTDSWVRAIHRGHTALAQHCPLDVAQRLVSENVVTLAQCRSAGIGL